MFIKIFSLVHNVEIASWIQKNINAVRVFKQKQLFIWSDGPDVGKTNLVEQLAKHCSVFHVPKTAFVDGYQSDMFDLVVCDEFKAQFTIQFLNEFVQGSKMHLNQKGTGHLKKDNPPMIFLSNCSLSQCYHKSNETGQFKALASRFLEIEVPLGSKIDVFHTWSESMQ